jgi:cytochrome c biogenesis protein CcdA
VDFVIGLILGLVLIWLAIGSRNDTGKRPDEELPQFTVVSAFGFGAVINFIGMPFAVPYFAAIDQILKADFSTTQALLILLKADFSTTQALLILLAYNLVYALPFAIVPVLSAMMGEQARPVLAKVNAFMEKASGVLMPLLLGAIGLTLVADAIKYFITGSPLF